MSERFFFPKDFFWGAATSAHQVEGNNRNDWTEWEKKNASELALFAGGDKEAFPEISNPENYLSGRAVDHYNRYEDDFNIAASMGHNAHRFSLEWSRIEPEEGKFDKKEIEHYRQVIRSLRKRGMEPFVTLWHWTIPLWIRDKGGIEGSNFPKYFSRYAAKMAEEYKGEIRFWMTLNEPTSVISNSYIKGLWPPNKKNPLKALKVSKMLARAHREGYNTVKKVDPGAQVGFGNIMTFVEPHRPNNLLDRLSVKFIDFWSNRYFFNLCGLETQDYLALQYYFHHRIGFPIRNFNENNKVSDMGWELYPKGIYFLLKDLGCHRKPIYITENGLADTTDRHRTWFIEESLKSVAQSIKEGIDIRGYFHWSLTDNFEWNKGFWPRFGLIEVDYGTLSRHPRPSAARYAEICRNNYIDY